ncbi:MAG TPA: YraN family protein [Ignavibacteriaceae bacterium]|nr:YraN family protein [Ignavibacteriaceae bacterium]
MSKTSKEFGKEGEDLAAKLLLNKNYKIIERNYRFGKTGEIDIIAKDPETNYLVFVEVKSRTNLEYGDPVYGITKNKMRQLKKIANAYLYEKEISEIDCRFDVVTVLFKGKLKPEIDHYINAFT